MHGTGTKIAVVPLPIGDPLANIAGSSFGSRVPLPVNGLDLIARKQCLVINKLVNEDVT